MDNNNRRLIEVAFPLKQTSIDSVHEKNVRHGHISTLHIWPARRPLAAARAALIATLLPDPGDKEERDAILKRLGGTLQKTLKKKKMPNGRVEEIEALETKGGVLHWGRESGPDLDWFRQEIRNAYGGRAPKVLDPFAGGGAIPLEAMRLGCEVTAVDINPVAWFILKCTLEYPQKLAGQKRRLPDFAIADDEFIAAYLKAKGLTPGQIKRHLRALCNLRAPLPLSPVDQVERGENLDLLAHPEIEAELLDADLAWHVRAWGRWVLKRARQDLARFYPTYAEYCSVKPYAHVPLDTDEPLKLVPINDAGETQTELLNVGFDAAYLANPTNPRWVAKPTVAYLWARTARCKACRATMPMLKTRWLVKKDNKRVVLTMRPREDKSGVEFGIDYNAKAVGGNAAQKREYDKRLGAGTMSRAGATCACCGTIMTMDDLKLEGRAGRLDDVLTAVIAAGRNGKEYRLPTEVEVRQATSAREELAAAFADLPYGVPTEPIIEDAKRNTWCVTYGVDAWYKLFSPRQLLSTAKYIKALRSAVDEAKLGYPAVWAEAFGAYLAACVSRLVDRGSTVTTWQTNAEKLGHTFSRFALPMAWDFAELQPDCDSSGGFVQAVEWVAEVVEHGLLAGEHAPPPQVIRNRSRPPCRGRDGRKRGKL